MAENNTILVVAVLAVIASLAAAGFSYYSLSKAPGVAGYATSVGTTQLDVTATAEINFTTDTVDFGAGKVTTGTSHAVLETGQAAVNGSWAGTIDPLVLANIGNVNVSLTLQANKNADEFIGGDATNAYQIKVTDKDAGTCLTNGLSTFTEVDKSQQAACTIMKFETPTNEIYVDVNLVIPYNSLTGSLSSTITAEGLAA